MSHRHKHLKKGSSLIQLPHTIMDMRNIKRHNVLTRARVKFSKSETSSLPRGGFKFLVSTGGGGGVNREAPKNCH